MDQKNLAPSFDGSPEPISFPPVKENLFNWVITINYHSHTQFICTIFGVRFDQALESAEIMVDYLNDVQSILVEKL